MISIGQDTNKSSNDKWYDSKHIVYQWLYKLNKYTLYFERATRGYEKYCQLVIQVVHCMWSYDAIVNKQSYL